MAGEARAAEQRRDWHAAVAALERLVTHPCAHHQVVESEVWDEIHELCRRVGNLDEAIAAKQRAVEAPQAGECPMPTRRAGGARRWAHLTVRGG